MADAKQTTSMQPGPYPYGGEAVWVDFLARFFGDEERGYEGDLSLRESQRESKMDAWDDYEQSIQGATQNYLRDLNNVQPIGISFGGQSMGQIIPQRPQELARKKYVASSTLPQQKLAFMAENTPESAALQNLSLLQQLAGQMQGWRYGIPTQTTSGSYDQGALKDTADLLDIGTSGLSLLGAVTGGDKGGNNVLAQGGNAIKNVWGNYGPDSWSDLNPFTWF